jgi:hypothetical protein
MGMYASNSTQFAQDLCADRAEAILGVPPPQSTIPGNARGPQRANKHQTNKLGAALFVRSQCEAVIQIKRPTKAFPRLRSA